MCPVSMVTPVQAAGAGGREAAASPRQTEKAAGTQRSAELELEPTCSRNGSRSRRRRELKVLRAQRARSREPRIRGRPESERPRAMLPAPTAGTPPHARTAGGACKLGVGTAPRRLR